MPGAKFTLRISFNTCSHCLYPLLLWLANDITTDRCRVNDKGKLAASTQTRKSIFTTETCSQWLPRQPLGHCLNRFKKEFVSVFQTSMKGSITIQRWKERTNIPFLLILLSSNFTMSIFWWTVKGLCQHWICHNIAPLSTFCLIKNHLVL